MSCAVARNLMDDALDGERPPELAAHLAACAACAGEWSRLVALEQLLRRPGEPPLPVGFHHRTMVRLDMSLSAPWLARPEVRAMLSVVTVLTGLLLVLVGGAMVAQAAGQPDEIAGWWDVATAWGGWGLSSLGWLTAGVPGSVAGWSAYGIAALALALLWFGALVVPRRAPRGIAHE